MVLRDTLVMWCDWAKGRKLLVGKVKQCDDMVLGKLLQNRFRVWWYLMSKERGEKDLERVQEYATSIQVQVSHLQSLNTRREKQVGDGMKELQVRTQAMEKKIDQLFARKAEMQKVTEMVNELEDRVNSTFNVGDLRDGVGKLGEKLADLGKAKLGVEEFATLAKRHQELATSVREQLSALDAALLNAATKQDVNTKADASCVEQALKLIALQLDDMTQLSAQDVEKLRVAMVKFLELSPDVRKAALSLGVVPNEPCLTCRERSLERRMRGHDAKYYSSGEDTELAVKAGSKGIVEQNLKFPLRLASAVNVARECESRGAIPSLKELFASRANWLAGFQGGQEEERKQAPKVALRTFFPAAASKDNSEESQHSSRSLEPFE